MGVNWSENGRLFTFGSNEWGQLGIGNNKTRNKPTTVKSKSKTIHGKFNFNHATVLSVMITHLTCHLIYKRWQV